MTWDEEIKKRKKRTVRPNQYVPFKKSSSEVVDRRIAFVERMLRGTQYSLKSEMLTVIKEEFKVERKMAEEYMARARDRLVLRLNQARADHRADSLAFYEGIISNPTTTAFEKIRARENVDKLLGLPLPPEPLRMQIEHSGGITQRNGMDVDIDVSVLPLGIEMKRKLLAMARAQGVSSASDIGGDEDNE